MNATTNPAQVRLARRSPAYWRVTIDNPPINVMGPDMVRQFQEVINTLETDEQVRVVVFDSAVEGYFLNHSDFTAKLEDLTDMPAGPTGLPPWPDFLVRLTRAPIVSIALIRGRATGNGSEMSAVGGQAASLAPIRPDIRPIVPHFAQDHARGPNDWHGLCRALRRSICSFRDRLPPLLSDLHPRDRPLSAADLGDGPLHLGKAVEHQHG
jgi:hypothetical protein